MLVQTLNEYCVLEHISVLFATLRQSYRKSLEKKRNKDISRNVVCNIFVTFSAVCSEYAKFHILAVKGKSSPITGLDRPRGFQEVNPLNAELNPICHLLVLLGAHHIFHVRGLRVKVPRFRDNGTGWR